MNKDYLSVIFCYFLWGLLPAFWKLLKGVNSVYVLACRILFSLLLCLIIMLCQKNFRQRLAPVFRDKQQLWRLIASSVLVTINWGFYILGLSTGHVIDCSLAYFMNPIMTILLGALLFHEKLNRLQWLSVLLAAVGVIIPVIQYGTVPYFALIVGGSFALYSAVKKKVAVDSMTSVFAETLFVSPLALGFVIFAELRGFGAGSVLHGWEFLLLPAAGVVTTIPLVLFARGVRNTPMSLVGVFMYVNPVLQLLMGVWLYKERFTATNATTFVFVMLALLLFFTESLLHRHKTVPQT